MMALNHLSKLWLEAEDELVDLVAKELCERHGSEIYGAEAVDAHFIERRKICFMNDARSCIAIVRAYDGQENPKTALHPIDAKDDPMLGP